ncbi:MAG: MerR family transcriptional regulator, partial [Lachnospiraceae bacterium]|nr:MerR family transcriptional regulator [Lachnospiraceae bacterium]
MDIEGHLFTITEAAKAVGISRSTVLRLEEAGFLEPRKVDPKNGFRYYDMDNIAQMGQYCILKRLGLKQDEIVSIYYGRADAKKALDNIEKELAQMKTRLEEYRIRYDKKRHHQFSFIDIPDVTCYTDVTEVSGMAEVEVFAYRTAESCVKAGYKTLLGSEPLFL